MGKFDITNAEDLRKLLRKSCSAVTREISERVANQLYAETKRGIYDAYKPKMYKRTYEFLNSINTETYSDEDGFYANVFFDPQKMNVREGTIPRGKLKGAIYGKHANNKTMDVRDRMVMYLEEGHGATIPWAYNAGLKRVGRHNYPSRDGAHMIRNTNEWIGDNLPICAINVIKGIANNNIVITKR